MERKEQSRKIRKKPKESTALNFQLEYPPALTTLNVLRFPSVEFLSVYFRIFCELPRRY